MERRQLRRDVVRAPVKAVAVEKPPRIRRKLRRVKRRPPRAMRKQTRRVMRKLIRVRLRPPRARLKRPRRPRLRPPLTSKPAPTRPLSARAPLRTTMRLARSPVARMASTPMRRTAAELAVDTGAWEAGYRTNCGGNPRTIERPGSPGPFFFQAFAVDTTSRRRYLKRLSQNHLVAINRLEPYSTKGGRHLHIVPLHMKTFSATPRDIEHQWYIVDAEGQVLGRLATAVANIIRGKHKPMFTPHMETGDNVIVLNPAKVAVTGT